MRGTTGHALHWSSSYKNQWKATSSDQLNRSLRYNTVAVAMLSLLSAAIFTLLCTKGIGADVTPKVDTGYAVYVGAHTMPNVAAFLGIPYAEPPVGEKRWRAPTPLDTNALKQHKRTIDATKYPDFCVQGTTGGGDAGSLFKILPNV